MRWTVVIGMVAFAALPGCGTDDFNRGGEISGKVSLDGKPLTGGHVMLETDDGKHSVSCEIGPAGEYRLPEPPLGECKVAVKTSHLRGMVAPPRVAEKKGASAKAGASAGMTFPKDVGLIYMPIPLKLEDPKTSGLKVTILRGKQPHDISLQGK